jgi:very-short-patch-repair endonuclease
MRREQTAAEALLWTRVRGRKLLGMRFRRQHAIGRYIVDLYCAERRLVVELDGSSHAGQADLPQAERGPGVRFLKGALQPIRGHAVALGGMAGGH